MSVEDQNPDLESYESDKEAQQNLDCEEDEENPQKLFNNLKAFQDIYANNNLIDSEATEAAAQQISFSSVSEAIQQILEAPSEDGETSFASEDDEVYANLHEINGLIRELFEMMVESSSSSEDDSDSGDNNQEDREDIDWEDSDGEDSDGEDSGREEAEANVVEQNNSVEEETKQEENQM